MANGKKLVIVESPTKMKSIQGYLGDDYEVLSSVGHIRDLASKKEIPADKKAAYGKYSIDVENDFDPFYVVNDRKTKTVAELKRALKTADEVLLATDGDREGEAIAWHLLEVLKPKVPVRRMIFHEITKDAIRDAAEHTRDLDVSLVDAQETRRVLDRLYGWDVSPVLWRKVGSGREGTALSAGRVQSAATRMVVERERERMAFVSASYWDVEALASRSGSSFTTRLNRLDGAPIARGGDYDDNGQLKKAVVVLDEAAARALADAITAAGRATVSKVEAKPGTRSPRAPFTTSTMQQEAGRKLSMSAKHAMGVAQRLYEKGFITYMRTDSVALSGQAISAARAQAVALYGDKAVPANPRVYKSKSKNAQEAHEAIRPSGETFRTPASLASSLDRDEQKLYDLIWKRTVASQMADAKYETTTVTLTVQAAAQVAEFTASGTVYTFKGFLEAYEEGADEKRNDDDADQSLPAVAVGDELSMSDVEPKGHSTSPKPRYTEASLVKALEEKGIGRPSTFASIIGVILDRGYVTKRGQALVPSWLAFSVVRLLEEHFADLVDYDFTAALEDDLDAIARGEQRRTEWLKSFYFGSEKQVGLRHIVDNLGEIDARELNSTRITDTATLRFGKYGPYLEVADPSGDAEAKPRIVNIPEDLAPDELTPEKARELIDAPVAGDRVLGENPENGKLVVVKDGRFGPYVQEVDAEEPEEVDQATGEVVEAPKKRGAKKEAAPKPRTASLFRSMSVDTIELDAALQLLSLPRVVGADPSTGDEITAQNGRFGPYLKKGTDSRSLDNEQQIFDITLEEALAKYAEPKYGARRASSALKEFDADPVSGKPIKLKDGRFGPYVTDGETNATVPRGENAMEITFERAVELIADKRAKGPAPKKTTTARKTAATKTTAAKTAAAKTTAAKTTATKTATTKTAAAKTTATRTTAAKTTAAKTTAAKTTTAKTTAAKTTSTTRKAPAKNS
ncbi:type I DNA topoisomerase [Microbacterium sp. NPDC089180]|uniref:DNA topoisomerase 1 n=1 Tax=Microbacterium galbum TaxID=3075994 RepID=A0ABU3T8G4_9MICO|nr:type I DNA topoisomerase [Microbacterium sp. KSW4-17]MDU0367653.1 type I DNA topoisomerase [Microbacterium sp. KSW4-17]